MANSQSVTTNEVTTKLITLGASDVDSANLSLGIVTGPSHGTLGSITGTTCTPNGSGGSSCTASVTYTSAGYAGPDAFSYKGYDGTAYANEAKVSITVTGTNYAFSGFFQPVDNPPIVNTVNSGQTIPEKWQLFNAATGAAISDPSSFWSFTSYQVSCQTWTGDASSAINEVAAGSSDLQYLGSGNWQFNWQTSKSWAKTCREAVLTLKDGSQHMAKFSFPK